MGERKWRLTLGGLWGEGSCMSNVVSIHPYFKTHEGKLDAFKALITQFTAKTAEEEKCHWYDFTVCGDTAHCREAYDGADGLLAHLGNVEAQIGEALTLSELVRVEVHGPAGELEKLKEPLADMNPDYYVYETGIGKP
jgi:quinol monooxygenase YgiN